jgi:hypothetical protein
MTNATLAKNPSGNNVAMGDQSLNEIVQLRNNLGELKTKQYQEDRDLAYRQQKLMMGELNTLPEESKHSGYT